MEKPGPFSTEKLAATLPSKEREPEGRHTPFRTTAITLSVGLASIAHVKRIIAGEYPNVPMIRPALLDQRGEVRSYDYSGALAAVIFIAQSENLPLVLHVGVQTTTLILLVTTKWPRPLKVFVPRQFERMLLGITPEYGNACLPHPFPERIVNAVHLTLDWFNCRRSIIVSVTLDPYETLLGGKTPLLDYAMMPELNRVSLTIQDFQNRSRLFNIEITSPPSLPTAQGKCIRLFANKKFYSFVAPPGAVLSLPSRIQIRQPEQRESHYVPYVTDFTTESHRVPFFNIVAALVNGLKFASEMPGADFLAGNHYLVSSIGDTYLYYVTGYVTLITPPRRGMLLSAVVRKSPYKGPPILCMTSGRDLRPLIPVAQIGPYGPLPYTPDMLLQRFSSPDGWTNLINTRSPEGLELLDGDFANTHGVIRGDHLPTLNTVEIPFVQYLGPVGLRPPRWHQRYTFKDGEYDFHVEQLTRLSRHQDNATQLQEFLELNKTVVEVKEAKIVVSDPRAEFKIRNRPPRAIADFVTKRFYETSDSDSDSSSDDDVDVLRDPKTTRIGYGARSPDYLPNLLPSDDYPMYSPPSPVYQHPLGDYPRSPSPDRPSYYEGLESYEADADADASETAAKPLVDQEDLDMDPSTDVQDTKKTKIAE